MKTETIDIKYQQCLIQNIYKETTLAKKYWLMKTEPNVFSIDDLKQVKKELWDGVRNYQARNFMRDDMKPGDEILIYHSRVAPMGVYGLAKVSKSAVPDPTQFDKKSKYYDPKSDLEHPRWLCVEIQFVKKLKQPVELERIKNNRKLKDMLLIQRGQRLSIQPVTKKEFDEVLKMEQSP